MNHVSMFLIPLRYNYETDLAEIYMDIDNLD